MFIFCCIFTPLHEFGILLRTNIIVLQFAICMCTTHCLLFIPAGHFLQLISDIINKILRNEFVKYP